MYQTTIDKLKTLLDDYPEEDYVRRVDTSESYKKEHLVDYVDAIIAEIELIDQDNLTGNKFIFKTVLSLLEMQERISYHEVSEDPLWYMYKDILCPFMNFLIDKGARF